MSGEHRNATENKAMMKICAFIVDKRNLFFLLFALAIAFSAVSRGWVGVENSISAFLPDTTETRQGLSVMEREFTTFGTAKVMAANLSYAQAQALAQRLEAVEGVSAVAFDDTQEHYHNVSALFEITLDWDEADMRCLDALEQVKGVLSGYDAYLSTSLGNTASETIADEMSVFIVYVAIIVVAVLLFTSETYAEVPVLLLTFVSAAVIQMGTNFFLGTISFVSNSVTIVLQLALSVDYAIIFCHRYREEHEVLPAREAVIVALSKAIPELSASSLTTIGGLFAMTLMQFKLGPDLGIVLIKAIVISLLTVFLLMPGLLMLFSGLMDRTGHRVFVPKIPFVGKLAYATRKIVPPVFLAAVIAAAVIAGDCPYVYGYSTLTTPIQNDTQIAQQMIEDNFGGSNMVALVVPAGNYEAEGQLLRALEDREEVDSALGLANVEAMDGYMLTDRLTPRQFSELLDLDYEAAQLLYAAYAASDADYAKIVNGLASYSVPLIDMVCFLYDEVDQGYITLEADLRGTLEEAYEQMNNARLQLQGEDYSRMLVYLNLPEEGAETFAFLDELHALAGTYYDGTVYVVGESTSQYDLCKTFERDNSVVGVVSILIVLMVLLFTFKSVGQPILLVLVIQGSIWLNFAVPALTGRPLFFICYLIVSSIQMGANIDYAIVISSRFGELKRTMNHRDAIIETMNLAFPTIITSGLMLAIAGTLIGRLTSEAAIAGIGQCLGRGTFISIFLVMLVLPQILLLGDRVIEKTSFSVSLPLQSRSASGSVRLDGLVRGTISGEIVGVVHARVKGDVNVNVLPGEVTEGTEDRHEET